jgi:hypothetical protein
MDDLKDLLRRIDALPAEEKRQVLSHLRKTIPLHPMEDRLKASAEAVLEAIARSTDLTIRGIEGIIAEASFAKEVLPEYGEWRERPFDPGQPYDFLLNDHSGLTDVRLQVKMQRRKEHRPLMAGEIYKAGRWPAHHYIVEVQRTRRGQDKTGAGTRPYRFGEFDILGVSLGAAKGRWRDFTFTVASWLIPDPSDPALVLKYQPVAPEENDDWTSDFRRVVQWLRSGRRRTIVG